MAGLTPEQRRVLGTIVRVANRRGIGPKLRLAAVETGLVESNLRNLAYGDGSSVGWRQETSSSYPNVNRRDVAASVNRFFNEALPLRGKYATAGALAQAVQRSAHPERYQAVRGQARQLLRGAGGVSGGSAGGGRAVAASTTTRDAGPQGSALALLQALAQQPQQPQSAGLQAPAFSASPALPKSYQPVVGGGGGAQPPDISALLAAIQISGDTGSTRTTTDVIGGGGGGGSQAPAGTGGPMGRGGYAYPLARRGKIIGTPYTGTHTLGNWQSDNAVDIAVPVGTRVRSIRGGRVVKVVHHPQDGSRFAGDQVTIQGPGGGVFFTHLLSANVRPGQQVKRGQVIGRSGSANGVAHLHIGRERGNPLREFG